MRKFIRLIFKLRPIHKGFCTVGVLAAATSLLVAASPAGAVPSFAVQTGQACQACHVGGFGPQLTAFGREFKLRGYTQRSGDYNVPLSAMAVASYLHTQKDQASPPASGYDLNDNHALDQISVFVAGGLGAHLGAFVQTTYDGIARAWSWDNLDVRAVTTTEIKGVPVVLGVSLNNSPTVQDAWNTTPAWGYPYTGSALAPSPAAAPLLSGGLAQEVLGATAYAWIDSKLMVEIGAYGSPSHNTLARLGADPFQPGEIHNLAPYGRLVWQQPLGNGTFEVGAMALDAKLYPGRDRTTGMTDHYTDVGLDASYILPLASGAATFNSRYIHEDQKLNATCLLSGLASNCANIGLDDLRADASYYWHNQIGGTVGLFNTTGGSNALVYAANRTLKPDSSGLLFQLDGTPFGAGTSPFGPRFNMRVGLQYTVYTRFNGARSNFDGAGANASDNNTLRVFTWFAY